MIFGLFELSNAGIMIYPLSYSSLDSYSYSYSHYDVQVHVGCELVLYRLHLLSPWGFCG